MKVKEIAEIAGETFHGNGDLEISQIASLENAIEGEISFADNLELLKEPQKISASCLFVPIDFQEKLPCAYIPVKNPKLAFAEIAKVLRPISNETGWDKTASIHDSSDVRASFIGAFVSVGKNSYIGEGAKILNGAKIGDNVSIGKCSIIHPNAVIYDDVEIGYDCVIHAGAIIGADGFGFVRGDDGYVKFPQVGMVVIEDNVEIGANSCIDRGALGETRIGEGTKIDNLVQVAHNVQIGKRVVIASQTGISGSVVIEDDCVIGGQVGFGDHSRVKSGAVIGSQAGVLPGKIVREGVWWGTPVQPLQDYKRLNAHVKSLPRLKEQIKELKRLISVLEKE